MADERIMEKLAEIHNDVVVCQTKIDAQKETITDHEKRLRKGETFRWKIMGGWASLGLLILWSKIKTFFGFPDA